MSTGGISICFIAFLTSFRLLSFHCAATRTHDFASSKRLAIEGILAVTKDVSSDGLSFSRSHVFAFTRKSGE